MSLLRLFYIKYWPLPTPQCCPTSLFVSLRACLPLDCRAPQCCQPTQALRVPLACSKSSIEFATASNSFAESTTCWAETTSSRAGGRSAHPGPCRLARWASAARMRLTHLTLQRTRTRICEPISGDARQQRQAPGQRGFQLRRQRREPWSRRPRRWPRPRAQEKP